MSPSLSGPYTVLFMYSSSKCTCPCNCGHNMDVTSAATPSRAQRSPPSRFFAVSMGALFNGEGPCVDSLVTQTAELNDVFRGGEGGECAQLAASLEVVISEVSALREAPLGHERGHCHFSAVAAGTPSASHKPQMITDNFCCATVSGNYQGKG